MPAGIQVWNAGSILTTDETVQTVKFLQYLTIPAANTSGSITDGRLTAYAGHTAFAYRTDGQLPINTDAQLTISGNTVSWNRVGTANNTSRDNVFVVGVHAI